MDLPRSLWLFVLSSVIFYTTLAGLPACGATLTVTNLGDLSGPSQGTLRQAVADAKDGDTIVFGVNGTIVLRDDIVIDKNLSIVGPGPANLAVSGDNQIRVFHIDPGVTVSISGITIMDGEVGEFVPERGGGIWNQGTLSINDTVFRHNTEGFFGQGGDAIYNTGSVSITTSTFDSNNATFANGGGIRNGTSGVLSVSDSTFVHNTGRAIYNKGTATVVNSTFFANYPGTGALAGFNGVPGAGIYNDKGGTLSAVNNTFAGDPSAQEGSPATSGFANHGTILSLWNNLFINTECFQLPSGSSNLSDSRSGEQNCPSPNPDFNPGFDNGVTVVPPTDIGEFGYYGGPTETINLVDDGSNPAIDGGGPGCPPYDQRGAARIGNCDIGAFEYGGSLTTVTVTGDSGLGTLRQAVSDASPGDTITFRVHGTITLATPVIIDKNLNIDGPGVSDLTVTGNGTANGGAFAVTANAAVAMSNFIIANSQSCSYGCGIYNQGILALTDMIFANNYAANGGGAIYSSGEVTARGVTFNDNVTFAGYGGAILSFIGDASVYDSTFTGNDACDVVPFGYASCTAGGAIFNALGNLTVSDSTFYSNTSGAGGAIANLANGNADISDSTFVSNKTAKPTTTILGMSCGGAICNVGSLQIKDSLFANDNPQYADNSCFGVDQGTANLSDSDSPGCPGQNAAFTSGDLGNLADNGGPTETMALLGGPAINGGVDCTPHDQRGVARFGPCDIGAYEVVPVDPTTHVQLNTPPGEGSNSGGVVVAPMDSTTGTTPLGIRFSGIDQQGLTSLATSATGPQPPPGRVLGNPVIYYDITTTATFTPPVDICIGYGEITFSTTNPRLGLYHYTNNEWVDVTTSIDTDNQLICGTVNSLSPLAVFEIQNLPPVANAGPNQTVEATSAAGAMVTLDGSGSSDPDGDAITYSWTGLFGTASGQTVTEQMPLGTNEVNLTVTDTHGLTDADQVQVTVQDTTPPVVTLPDNLTIEATGPNGAVASFNPTATDLVDGSVAVNCTPASGATFALGNTTVNCSSTDAHGNTTRGSFTVSVVDTTPPTIHSVTANPAALWPPDHTMRTVTVTTDATDLVDPSVKCEITGINSNEAISGNRGDQAPDWQNTAGLTTQLRAERNGNGTGRLYTLAISCNDEANNVATTNVVVTVPHDRRH